MYKKERKKKRRFYGMSKKKRKGCAQYICILGAAAAMYISSRRDRNDTIGPQVSLGPHTPPRRDGRVPWRARIVGIIIDSSSSRGQL